MKLRDVLVGALGAGLLTGCAVGAAAVAPFQAKTIGTAVDESNLSSQIKTKLVARGGYGEVDVEVSGGLVLLTGRVISPDMRVIAERIAWSSRLTEDVANEIQIEPPGGFRANVADEWITARVRSRLVTSLKVRGVNYNIETYDGVVYLMGIARSQAELNAATEKASYVRGVRKVVSYVELREPAKTYTAELSPSYNQPAEPAYSAEPGQSDDELAGGTW